MTIHAARSTKCAATGDVWFRIFNEGNLVTQALIPSEIADEFERLLALPDECTWTHHPERHGHCDYWETGCGNAFTLTDGTPAENEMIFCPYCGRRLEVRDE